jgi:hypothetical protein
MEVIAAAGGVLLGWRKVLVTGLAGMLLVACGAPPQAAAPPTRAAPPAPAPTSLPSTPSSAAATPTPQAAQKTQTVTAQQTVQAQQGQLANVLADQSASAQQVAGLQQTAAAAQHTVAAQQSEIQAVTANQTVAAQQLAVVQQTAVSARQSLTGLQTAVANLATAQQTAGPRQQAAPPQVVSTPQPAGTKLLYAWFFKRPIEPPKICGPGQGNPCLDSAPNQGTQYISGHVIDQRGSPVGGITVQAHSDSITLFNSTDSTGYYSILLYTSCPSLAQRWDVYIVDANNSLSSYVKTFTYRNCAEAGEFHIDFVQAS